MLRAKTLIVSTVLNVATLLLSPGAHALLADLENRVGSAQQSLSLNKEQKSAICRVSLSDKAVMIASRFNITAENQNMPIIETQIFLFDEAVTSKQQDENSLIAERRYPTSGNAC
ncbi:MAG TPA: hypothetical protein VN132_01270, partial [Bdellovibrio sp.]|nr:hypothetical protein [Bdellovibrio sp.]